VPLWDQLAGSWALALHPNLYSISSNKPQASDATAATN
jgi:hypothetical protein